MRGPAVLLAGFALAGGLLGGVVSLLQPETWTSTARVLMTPTVGKAAAQDLADAGSYVDARMETWLQLATSSRVRASATDLLDGDNTSIGEIGAEREPGTAIITLRVNSRSAEDAQRDVDLVEAAFVRELAAVESGHSSVGVGVQEIQAPSLPNGRTSPRVSLNVLGGLLAGGAAGLVVVLLRRSRRSRASVLR